MFRTAQSRLAIVTAGIWWCVVGWLAWADAHRPLPDFSKEGVLLDLTGLTPVTWWDINGSDLLIWAMAPPAAIVVAWVLVRWVWSALPAQKIKPKKILFWAAGIAVVVLVLNTFRVEMLPYGNGFYEHDRVTGWWRVCSRSGCTPWAS